MNTKTFVAAKKSLEDGYLHLKDIEVVFVGRTPTSATTLHLQVDNTTHDFRPEALARTIHWKCELFVSQRSRIVLSVHRVKSGLLNLFAEPVVGSIVLEAETSGMKENSVISRSGSEDRIRVNFTFAGSIARETFIDLMGNDVRSALASQIVLLDRIKNISAFVKIVLSIGKEISELNDGAKVVFGLANKLFKFLQEQQEFHHMAIDLAGLLDVKLHLTEIIPEKLRHGSVQKSIKDILGIVEEALKFIKANICSKSLNSLLTRREELTDLKAKLFAASEDLSLCLTANVFIMVSDVHQNVHDSLLKEKLNPVLPAHSSIDHRCLEGTREEPLVHIMNWAQAKDSPSKLYHVHGVAGSGKSAMASTTCQKLEDENQLAGAFFCKRDIPEQRDPSRILPSLSYTLALRCEKYKECVILSLKDEPDITSRPIEHQVKVLFQVPFAELSQSDIRSRPFVFVVDALDECGDDVSRPRLVDILCQITTYSDWLKVFIASRPLDDIMRSIALQDKGKVASLDVNALDSGGDIKLYTRASLKELVQRYGLSELWVDEGTIDKLTTLASGLFIWTSTMTRFVRGQLDKDGAMEIVLSGNVSGLDDLYTTVIEGGSTDDKNRALKKAVLSVILITARNRPLSIDGLHDFLQGTGKKVSKGTLVAVINHLRSVLYEDISKGNAIRVCHPSFLDFLKDRERSGVYWSNTEQLHTAMAETSLSLMKTMLKFNICGLESSYVANKDIGDLSRRIKDRIPESLIYGCLYWTTHLAEANRGTIEILVTKFFQSLNVIYWVEVLSLVEEVKLGLDALRAVMDFFKDNSTLSSLATDLHWFISSSYEAISHSTPHLYVSALAWLPERSPLRSMLSCMRSSSLIVTGRNENWPSLLWMYSLGSGIRQVTFSPDNRKLAACSTDGKVVIFNAKTGVVEMRLQHQNLVVWSVAFSPDGKRLVSGSADCSVTIWDLCTGGVVGKPLTGHSDEVTSVVYSPDGHIIASRSWDGIIRILDAISGALVHVMEGCQGYGRLAYSFDGEKIACCGEEGVVIRDARSGELLSTLSNIGHVFDVTYSQDGRFLASGGGDDLVRLWDAKSLSAIAEFEGHVSYVYSVTFTSGGNTLLSASSEGKMLRWDISSRLMNGVAVQESNIWSAACSSNGQLYAAASENGSLRVWYTESHFNAELLSVNDRLWQVACSPGGSEIAAASSNGQIYIYSLDSGGGLLRTLRGHTSEVDAVVYSPDGNLLASGSDDFTVRIWDATTGLELRKLEGHTEWVLSVVFLPDGKHIASSSADGTVRRWNIDDDDVDGAILYRQDIGVRSMCISQDGRLLALGGADGCIQLGDSFGGKMKEVRLESNAAVRTLAFSPDKIYLASGSVDFIIRLWHVDTLTEVRTFKGHTDFILSVSFSQDGQQLLSTSGDRSICQWRVDTGVKMRQLKGHTNVVNYSTYSMDEKHIISCSADGTTRVWNADPEENVYVAAIDLRLSSLELREGWIVSKTGELLLWIPSEYRNGVGDMCEKCFPADAPNHPVRLDWSKLVKGENWIDVLASDAESETSVS